MRAALLVALALAACGGAAKPAAKPAPAPAQPEPAHDLLLAFVLLDDATVPTTDAVLASYRALPGDDAALAVTSEKDGTQTYDLGGELAAVGLIPAPVPNGEAEDGARYSFASIADSWQPPPHAAHLIVSLFPGAGSKLSAMKRFTRLVAAVTEASGALGVYWNGVATHRPEFFLEVVRDDVPGVMLWTGVSIAKAPDGRVELLSSGMSQLELPDLLLSVPPDAGGEAFSYFFDLLAYEADYGKAIGEGETVGRDDTQKLPVHYVASPVTPDVQVWRVELP